MFHWSVWLHTHMLIVVTCLVVNTFACLAIPRSPLPWILVTIGGKCSYKPPGAFQILWRKEKHTQDNQKLRGQHFEIREIILTLFKLSACETLWSPLKGQITQSYVLLCFAMICYVFAMFSYVLLCFCYGLLGLGPWALGSASLGWYRFCWIPRNSILQFR